MNKTHGRRNPTSLSHPHPPRSLRPPLPAPRSPPSATGSPSTSSASRRAASSRLTAAAGSAPGRASSLSRAPPARGPSSSPVLLHAPPPAASSSPPLSLFYPLTGPISIKEELPIEPPMGLLRQFQSLIMVNRCAGTKSLCNIDLTRQLFGNTVTPASAVGGGSAASAVDTDILKSEPTIAVAALKMQKIRLPRPIYSFQAITSSLNEPRKIDCFPLSDRKMVWADDLGRTFVFDAETSQMEIIPTLHKPKRTPISLFAPIVRLDERDGEYGSGSSFLVMERTPILEANCISQWSDQFEAFVYEARWPTSFWQHQLLPPLPYVRELKYWRSCSRPPEISSYAVLSVDGGSHVCISVKGVGTYCMDTASHTWSKVGEWTLPFYGRVEYVPELKLWFGFTAGDRRLAAADLSSMDSQPQLVGSWKELYFPEEWKECRDPQLVNLGFGRFCIARFQDRALSVNGKPGVHLDQNITVFTGVELVPHTQDPSSGKVELQMIPCKSLAHLSNGTAAIDAVF